MDIYERLDKILPKIQEKQFRENKGLGNEIGYYIFDYEPENELIVREHIRFLKEKLNNENSDGQIIEFDLYEIMIEILEEKNYLNKSFELEEKKGTEYILKGIQKTLRLTLENDLVIDYIRTRVKDNHIVFITGVGKAWPIIRSHLILNNLHSVVDYVPVIMFFPGTYSGQDLVLFEDIKDDNYYRAFKLVDR